MDDELRWYLLAQKKMEGQIANAFRAFRQHGIEPILIKGWAASRFYPPDVPRFYGDIDLAVSAGDYERAMQLVEDPDSQAKGIDLHRELRHLDTLGWDQLFDRSLLVEADGVPMRVLAPEDHLRVLCVHWLTNAGEPRDRLFDIYYAVQNREASFDWSRCLDAVAPNRRSWIIATVGLAHKYLGLDLRNIPFAEEAALLPEWLTRSLERSWATGDRRRGIDESITDPRGFVRQVRNRLPPNPIQATIFCEGAIDHGSRAKYQIRDFFGRMVPSARRLSKAIANQYRWMTRTK